MSEVRLPAPVRATKVDDPYDSGVAGCFTLAPAENGARWGFIKYICPCGCGDYSSLPIGKRVKPPRDGDRATWQWDGNEEAPTLSPSIHHIGHWHGWLRSGMWVQA